MQVSTLEKCSILLIFNTLATRQLSFGSAAVLTIMSKSEQLWCRTILIKFLRVYNTIGEPDGAKRADQEKTRLRPEEIPCHYRRGSESRGLSQETNNLHAGGRGRRSLLHPRRQG